MRRKNPRVHLASQLHGGGQERQKRSGTLYVPQIVGFGKAIEMALGNQPEENQRLKELRDRLWKQIKSIPGCYLNGDLDQR